MVDQPRPVPGGGTLWSPISPEVVHETVGQLRQRLGGLNGTDREIPPACEKQFGSSVLREDLARTHGSGAGRMSVAGGGGPPSSGSQSKYG